MARVVSLPKKLVGRTVAFVGCADWLVEDLTALVRTEGGRVVVGERATPDYLVVGEDEGRAPRTVVAAGRATAPAVRVVDRVGFYRLVAPTADDLMAVLAAGPHPHEVWHEMRLQVDRAELSFDLSGRDFRGIDLTDTNLAFATVDGGDFRGGRLSGARFCDVRGARFDGADMRDADFVNARACSLKRVNLDDGRFNPSAFVGCDFTGAVLTRVLGSSTRAVKCNFSGVKAAGSAFDECTFGGCNFTKADLSRARLEKSDFTNANLAGADLSRADARGVKFVNADLRKAKFRETVLTGADFTGARIDGADFTGANLTAVVTGELDLSKAKNFAPRPRRRVGPNLKELARAATASKKFLTTIELDLGPGEFVVLEPQFRTYGSQPILDFRYSHTTPHNGFGSSVQALTFEKGMLALADLWHRGVPKFDTVRVEAKKCPLKGKDAQTLAAAAWHEAFGLRAPRG